MEEFLNSLGIYAQGKTVGNKFIIEIPDADTMASYYSTLDKSDEVEEDGDISLFTEDTGSITFNSDNYEIVLISDFNADMYKLVCKQMR